MALAFPAQDDCINPMAPPTGAAGWPTPESYVTLGSDTTYFQTHPTEDRHLEATSMLDRTLFCRDGAGCPRKHHHDLYTEVPVSQF